MAQLIPVTVDNFARAETDRMISGILEIVGGVGIIHHDRVLGPLDNQTVIRQNRDTLYSVVILDLAGGATLTIPDFGDRYLSVMVINQDHYINRVLDRPGTYELTADEFGTDYVVLAFRILFDPTDEADVATVHRLQDDIRVESRAQRPFHPGTFDPVSHKTVRDALLTLAKGISGLSASFGRKDQVDPIHHLIATASAWGGLPDDQAHYISIFPELPLGRYRLTLRDVPADAFYSVSVYNADGYFEPGPSAITNVNSVFGERNEDGSMTIWLGEFDDDRSNVIPTPEGWNVLLRLYKPRVADLANWRIPAIEPAE